MARGVNFWKQFGKEFDAPVHKRQQRRHVLILLVYALNLVQRPIAPISIYSPASLGRPLLSACPAESYSHPRFSSWKYREESSTLVDRQPDWLKEE